MSHLSSFTNFAHFPPEIRNYVWKICVQDYPARLIDLREYRRKINAHTRDVVGFKSRVPAPTLLYVCRDSRSIAQESYTKAFGADIPAETWIDFEKDILYLSLDFCYLALEGYVGGYTAAGYPRFHTGREEPCGYFLKDHPLNQDIQKVKDLAITGLWNLGSSPMEDGFVAADISIIVESFANLERFTLIEAQHSADLTADLVLVPIESHHLSAYNSEYQDEIMNYREHLFDRDLAWQTYEPWEPAYAGVHTVWAGLKPYPWFEFGIIAERRQQQNCKSSAGIRPRKTGSRLATKEDRERSMPDPKRRLLLLLYEE